MDARPAFTIVDRDRVGAWRAIAAASKEVIDAGVDVVDVARAAITAASPQLLRMRAATAALAAAVRSARAGAP